MEELFIGVVNVLEDSLTATVGCKFINVKLIDQDFQITVGIV